MWETRVTAGCEQHNIEYSTFREGLHRANVLINRKNLADLACWEPHSFKALTDIAKRKAVDDGLASLTKNDNLDGIITRGSIK